MDCFASLAMTRLHPAHLADELPFFRCHRLHREPRIFNQRHVGQSLVGLYRYHRRRRLQRLGVVGGGGGEGEGREKEEFARTAAERSSRITLFKSALSIFELLLLCVFI
jgi:hypothetical protein